MLHQSRQCDTGIKMDKYQWNRIENQKINSHSYNQLIFNEDTKEVHWGQEKSFQ